MIRAIIIEDEDFAVDRLKMLLGDSGEAVEIVEVLDSVKRAVNWLNKHQIDLIFLDIHLADGNAFKIFEQVEIRTPIIFTTAYHEYALRAFEQFSIDYLLKPISREKLKDSLHKLRSLKNGQGTHPIEQNFKELIDTMLTQKVPKRFMVNVGNKVKVIEASEVAYFVSDTRIIFLQLFDGKRYPLDVSLKQLQLSLPPDDFFRVNRQYLINRKIVKELQYYSQTHLKVITPPISDEDIVVAREKIGAFKKWLAGE